MALIKRSVSYRKNVKKFFLAEENRLLKSRKRWANELPVSVLWLFWMKILSMNMTFC